MEKSNSKKDEKRKINLIQKNQKSDETKDTKEKNPFQKRLQNPELIIKNWR